MAKLQTGAVTLLFTNIGHSARLEEQFGEGDAGVLADVRRLLRSGC